MHSITRTAFLLGESGSCVTRCARVDGASWIEKSGPPAEIAQEAAALRWCGNRLPVARVLGHRPGILKMSELPGRPASEVPAEIAAVVLADALHQIHSVPVAGCPAGAEWDFRIQKAVARLKGGLVDELDFDDENLGRSAESIVVELRSFPPLPDRLSFTHGDATLENFLVQDQKLSGIVDIGRSGLTHPAQDWALALRSMRHHFGPKGERQLRSHVPHDCADVSLLRRFLLLDEFF